MVRLKQMLGLSFAAVSLLMSCGGSGSDRQDSNTFYFNVASEPNSLDPVQISQQASWWIGKQIYNGLVDLDSNLQPVPSIARSWEISDDGRTYTFHLRNDVRFADDECFEGGKGRRLTAEDVRYSFERACTPGKSAGYWLFRGKLEGADAYYDSRADSSSTPVEHVSGLIAENDTTLIIRLTTPFAPFLSTLTTPFGYIAPREAVEHYGNDFFRHPVGAGPFRMTEWNEGQQVILVRNENYFGKDAQGNRLPYLDSVWITFAADVATVFTDFQNGNLDLLTTVDPTFAERILSENGENLSDEFSQYTLHKQPGMSVEYYGFTLDTTTTGGASSPFSRNVHLRRAVNYAIDRERIAHFVLKGLAMPAVNGPIPPSTPGFTGVHGYTYDPEMAQRELDSAGYPGGKGLEAFTLTVSNNSQFASVAEAVQQDLKKVGLTMNIQQKDHPSLLSLADKGEIALWRTSWLADYPHAENFMANFYSPYKKPAGPNRARYENRSVDSLYLAAFDPTLSVDQWSSIYGEAEQIVVNDAPWVFLYYSVVRHITQPWISGYSVDPLQVFDLTRVRKNGSEQSASSN